MNIFITAIVSVAIGVLTAYTARSFYHSSHQLFMENIEALAQEEEGAEAIYNLTTNDCCIHVGVNIKALGLKPDGDGNIVFENAEVICSLN